MTASDVLRWHAAPADFSGLSSAVLALPASHWERLGAAFVARSDDPDWPERTACAIVELPDDRQQEFALVDEGAVTTLLVAGDQRERTERASRVLGLLAYLGHLDISRDILQSAIGDLAGLPERASAVPAANGAPQEPSAAGLVAALEAQLQTLQRALELLDKLTPAAPPDPIVARQAVHSGGKAAVGHGTIRLRTRDASSAATRVSGVELPTFDPPTAGAARAQVGARVVSDERGARVSYDEPLGSDQAERVAKAAEAVRAAAASQAP